MSTSIFLPPVDIYFIRMLFPNRTATVPSAFRIYKIIVNLNIKEKTKYTEEEAKERDHRKIGKDMGLFMVDDLIGRGLPIHTGGFTNNFEYKGIDLSIFFQWSYGNDVLNANRLFFENSNKTRDLNQYASYADRWTPENPTSNIPRLNANDKYTNSASTRWLTSSDYLSINNITVGYTLPQQLVKKVMLDKVRVYFTADNVALISARKGLDPRQSYISATTALYTPIRTISGGISLTF